MPDGGERADRRGTLPSWTTDCLLMEGDAAARMRGLPDGSVNAIVTSPPYFGLRRYGADGEIGLERTPSEYVGRLVEVFREARRVLRDDGSCWIVIGDSYANDTKWGGATSGKHGSLNHGNTGIGRGKRNTGCKEKELIGVPWRLAFALSDDGWYRRHVIVWEKSNPLVESVKDRCTVSHEYVLHMTKRPTYFHDWFAISEPSSSSSLERIAQATFREQAGGEKDYRNGTNANRSARRTLENYASGDSAYRNARSVWTIAVEPSYVKHTAMFPTRLASRIIRASTPDGGCCAACGAPRRRLLSEGKPNAAWMAACGADSKGGYEGKARKDYTGEGAQDASATKARILAGMRVRTTLGWTPTCACGTRETIPALTLDPFSGASTSGLSAARLGRDSIGIDLKADYHAIAEARLRDPKVKCRDGDGTQLAFREPRVSRA